MLTRSFTKIHFRQSYKDFTMSAHCDCDKGIMCFGVVCRLESAFDKISFYVSIGWVTVTCSRYIVCIFLMRRTYLFMFMAEWSAEIHIHKYGSYIRFFRISNVWKMVLKLMYLFLEIVISVNMFYVWDSHLCLPQGSGNGKYSHHIYNVTRSTWQTCTIKCCYMY